MSEPMRKAIDDVRRLREEREAYRANVVALQETKAAVLVVSDRLDALRWEHEILAQRTERVVAERDALAAKFAEAIHEITQKAGFKSLLLEAKLAAAAEDGERAALILADALAAANVDPASVGADPRAVHAGARCLAERDALIGALEADVQAASAAYDSTLDAFRAKMAEEHIPVSELGFPLATARDVLLAHVKR